MPPSPPMTHPQLSVVVPLHNEEDSVAPLVDAVQRALAAHPAWELVLVDDGSRDGSWERIQSLVLLLRSLILAARGYRQEMIDRYTREPWPLEMGIVGQVVRTQQPVSRCASDRAGSATGH